MANGAPDTGDDWTLPFTRQEYDGRLKRLRTEMERRGIALLYVTSPANLVYLLGHESVWFDGRNITGLAVPVEPVTPVYFDTDDHRTAWPPTIQDAVTYGEGEPFYYPQGPDKVMATLRERGLLKGVVGLELWSWAPGGPALQLLARGLRTAGAQRVVDASFVVDHVRIIKSPQEIDYTRIALAIADKALRRLQVSLHPGVTEKELAGAMYQLSLELGGDEPALRMMVHSGPNTNRFHRPASERKVERGDMVMVDMSASYRHYHGNTGRAFSLGPNKFWSDVLARVNDALWSTTADAESGMATMELQRRMDRAVDRAGLRRYVWWVGGYTLGISLPPDWVGHVYLNDAESVEPGYLVPGFVANWEVQLEDREAHQGAGIIDTMIMTGTGIELPAQFPRTLTMV